MSGKYAAGTTVPITKSREDIRKTLERFGVTATAFLESQDGRVSVAFEAQGFRVQMTMQLPSPDDHDFRWRKDGTLMPMTQQRAAWEQACRQRWRSLGLGIKAKLALIDDGITSFEQEFLAHIVLAGGQTVGQRVIPDLVQIAATGNLPALVPGQPAISAKVIELPSRSGQG